MPVDSKKPISEESILEEECEDEMITVTPFSIEPDNEVTLFSLFNDILLYLIEIFREKTLLKYAMLDIF